VPRKVIDSMLDIMPARGLVIHEYKKHGTCSGLSPADYFALSRALFEQIKIPARYLNPRTYVTVTPGQIETDFLKTNPALSEDMISISCGRERRLREVRICFSREQTLIPCGPNEDQAKLCRLGKIVMPPVRGR
jgi:ribonuclease T2